mgnify:FL=1
MVPSPLPPPACRPADAGTTASDEPPAAPLGLARQALGLPLIALGSAHADHPGFNGWDPEVEVPKAQEELRRVKEAGIDTIVELSPIGLGRSLDLITRACEGSGRNVVLATSTATSRSTR